MRVRGRTSKRGSEGGNDEGEGDGLKTEEMREVSNWRVVKVIYIFREIEIYVQQLSVCK